ncbi:MAG: hypothetical protein KatS3mg096_709 [Candidatus Parcubacteria bacterium]|nr:MAG: hypothetical protein KatS3mg096_682 [Candidatus Parcubacteria bacterium]GIW67841.1 MAG: hypothetical protein KatS3mg096_709 [Candidatus Parcubacteria bacterium]
MGQIQITIGIVMLLLFSVALIGFLINFSNDNNPAVSITQDQEIIDLYSKQIGNSSELKTTSESTYESIIKSNIEQGSQTVPSTGAFSPTPPTLFNILENIFSTINTKIFGGKPEFQIFTGVFISLIIFVIGLYLYKTLRGFPD